MVLDHVVGSSFARPYIGGKCYKIWPTVDETLTDAEWGHTIGQQGNFKPTPK